jgi:hypothetical protein
LLPFRSKSRLQHDECKEGSFLSRMREKEGKKPGSGTEKDKETPLSSPSHAAAPATGDSSNVFASASGSAAHAVGQSGWMAKLEAKKPLFLKKFGKKEDSADESGSVDPSMRPRRLRNSFGVGCLVAERVPVVCRARVRRDQGRTRTRTTDSRDSGNVSIARRPAPNGAHHGQIRRSFAWCGPVRAMAEIDARDFACALRWLGRVGGVEDEDLLKMTWYRMTAKGLDVIPGAVPGPC